MPAVAPKKKSGKVEASSPTQDSSKRGADPHSSGQAAADVSGRSGAGGDGDDPNRRRQQPKRGHEVDYDRPIPKTHADRVRLKVQQNWTTTSRWHSGKPLTAGSQAPKFRRTSHSALEARFTSKKDNETNSGSQWLRLMRKHSKQRDFKYSGDYAYQETDEKNKKSSLVNREAGVGSVVGSVNPIPCDDCIHNADPASKGCPIYADCISVLRDPKGNIKDPHAEFLMSGKCMDCHQAHRTCSLQNNRRRFGQARNDQGDYRTQAAIKKEAEAMSTPSGSQESRNTRGSSRAGSQIPDSPTKLYGGWSQAEVISIPSDDRMPPPVSTTSRSNLLRLPRFDPDNRRDVESVAQNLERMATAIRADPRSVNTGHPSTNSSRISQSFSGFSNTSPTNVGTPTAGNPFLPGAGQGVRPRASPSPGGWPSRGSPSGQSSVTSHNYFGSPPRPSGPGTELAQAMWDRAHAGQRQPSFTPSVPFGQSPQPATPSRPGSTSWVTESYRSPSHASSPSPGGGNQAQPGSTGSGRSASGGSQQTGMWYYEQQTLRSGGRNL